MTAARSLERIASVAEEILAEHREAQQREREGHRSNLRRVSAASMLNATGAGQLFKPVPSAHLREGGVVVCPCGSTHDTGKPGDLRRHGCGRWTIPTNRAVLVWREPEEAAA